MKKQLFSLMIISSLMLSSSLVSAQAWGRNSKVLSLGFGASQFFHVDNYYYGKSNEFRNRNWYWPVTGQLNFQGEFGVHKYVGLGFTTGIGGRGGRRFLRDGYGNGYLNEINIPIGMIVNFHFYQLIADKKQKDIHSDKLDLYVGASIGSGIAITHYDNNLSRITPLAFGGMHVGLRYYFKPNVGINAELGWGKSLVNAGFVFKI